MENAIQNIILEEMENLDGILIATTNLSQNLDMAFERRFLYKIKYEKPQPDARKSIWKTMISGLKKKDADTLSTSYDFSGGEIENIARKCTIESILSGKKPTIESIKEFCDQEQLCNSKKKRIIVGY